MKQIITGITGGYPATIDLLDYLQENTKEQTSILAKTLSLNSNPSILYGAEFTLISGGTASAYVDYTAGALWYSDEIYLIDSGTLSTPSLTSTGLTTLEWELDETHSNSVIFKDGVSNNIYNSRKAVLVLSGSSWGISNLSRLNEAFIEIDSVDYGGTFQPRISSSDTLNLAYRRTLDGFLELRGECTMNATSTTGNILTTLPTGYRPTISLTPLMAWDSTGIIYPFYIKSDGEIYISVSGLASASGLKFSCKIPLI